MAESRRFDFVLFGASGFTGRFCVDELAILNQKSRGEEFSFAIAGSIHFSLSKKSCLFFSITSLYLPKPLQIAIFSYKLQRKSSKFTMILACIQKNCNTGASFFFLNFLSLYGDTKF